MEDINEEFVALPAEIEKLRFAGDRYLYHYYIENKLVEEIFQRYPSNRNLDEVLLKVSLLNAFYSTNIEKHSSVLAMAEHIVSLSENKMLDELIDKADKKAVTLITDIPRKKDEIKVDRNGYSDPYWHYLSFASKYCCNSNKDKDYFIYDSLVVGEVYKFFQDNRGQYGKYTHAQLETYATYCEALSRYIEIKRLKGTKREADWFIWGNAKLIKEHKIL